MRIESQNLGTQRLLSQTSRAIERSLARLSVGQRVVRPGDDMAAYSQSVTLTAQSRGLASVAKGLNQHLSAVQIATSALSQQLELIQRMREIAVQSSSGTLSDENRRSLSQEMSSLLASFSEITNSTRLGDIHLLNGSSESLDLSMPESSLEETFVIDRGTGTYSNLQTNFTFGISGQQETFVKTGDLDADGDVDLVSMSLGANLLTTYLNDGDGLMTVAATATVTNSSNVSLGDINNDGILDIVVGKSTNVFDVYSGNGEGAFSFTSSRFVGGGATALNIADIDNDGNADIISGTTYLTISWGDGNGTFTPQTTLGVGSAVTNIEIADLNNDGNLDIVNGSYDDSAIYSFIGQGGRNMPQAQSILTGFVSMDAMKLGDFDLDGDVDIVASDVNNSSVSVFNNNGGGGFSYSDSVDVGGGAFYDLEVADINRDGILDIIGIDSTTNITSFLSQHIHSYSTANSTQGLASQTQMNLGDFNGDGVIDLVLGSNATTMKTLLSTPTESNAILQTNVSTQAKAQLALTVLDNAIEKILDRQSSLSALYQGLESQQATALLSVDTIEEARTQMFGADIAYETAELVRNQILQQVQVAAMAQANLNLRTVLELFNF